MKQYLITPSFCKADLLEDFLTYLYSTFSVPNGTIHVLIDNHYPINKSRNRDQIKSLAKDFKCIYVDSGKDLGLHEGINHAIQQVGIKKEDQFICCDPDDRPTPGSFKAIHEVMNADKNIVVCSTLCQEVDWSKSPVRLQSIAGYQVYIHPTVEMWNVSGYNLEFVFSVGGFNEIYPYYGGAESYFYDHYRKNKNYKIAYLKDYKSSEVYLDKQDPFFFDPEYRLWKNDAVTGYKHSFEKWLSEKKSS